MTGIRLHIMVVLGLALSLSLKAQDTINVKQYTPRECKSFGKNAMQQGDFYAASKYFEQYLKLRPNNYKVAYKLAESYRLNRDYMNAQKWYQEAFDKSKAKKTIALYYYALMLKMNGSCDKAKEQFNRFKKESSGDKSMLEFRKQMKNEIAGCDSAVKMENMLAKIAVTHLDTSINKIHVEHAPVLLDDNSLMYASLRTDKKVYTTISAEDTVVGGVRKFYTAKKEGDKWTYSGEYTEGPFNEEKINTTNGAFSPDGKRFYFTRCKPNWKNKMICAIYVSEKQDGGSWSEPVMLDKKVNNPKYTSTQPTVAIESVKHNEVIYFVSDRPKGRGGLDIWFTIYDAKKKSYTVPKNAGSKVNTSQDEVTPYFDMDHRTLFFSSNGWPGVGGLDVFKAVGELRKFTQPENIGLPINSSNDDLYYTEAKNKEDGFFVSNRKGGVALKNNPTCCDDIYSFKRLEYVKVNINGIVTAETEGDKPGTTDARVSLYLIDPHEKEPIFIRTVESSKDGKYDLNLEAGNDYKIVYEKDGYTNASYSYTTKEITTSQTLNHDAVLKKVPTKPFRLTNVHYETNKHDLLEPAKRDIDTTLLAFMIDNPEYIVEVSSHTDNVASDSYNIALSQRRADGVIRYLISKGIPAERLIAKGYGETKPVAPNTTDEGRAENRRTEFVIVGKLPPKEKEYEHDSD